MEVTKAEIDAVLDAHGRFVWTPNALTLDGQQNVPCDLQEGESLLAFLRRHVPGIDSGAWAVKIGGIEIPRRMWAKTYPKHGMHIACRATVGKQAVQLVAVAALAYFSGGLAAGLYGAMGGTYVAANAGLMLSALQMGVFVAGSILINKVLGPKTPKVGTPEEAKQVYSLRSQRNSARPYEPIPVLWGEMRVVPDLASQPYAWYESDDQYLSTILLGGVNVHSAADLSIGDTPIGSYSDVEVMYSQFTGMPHQPLTLAGNVDTIPGGELPDTKEWVTRTTSVDTTSIGVDFEATVYVQGNQGLKHGVIFVDVFYRQVGSSSWLPLVGGYKPGKEGTWRISSNTTETHRRSFSKTVPQGQYEVRCRIGSDKEGPQEKRTAHAVWTALRSHQPNTADHGGLGRIGIKIKATGQLSGALDTVRVTYRAKPMPIWTGTAWATATTRENGLSNPGAILLQALRGIWHKGSLQFGYGLSDDHIDIEGLKAFMLHCAANGYTYDRWITSSMSLREFCQEVALAGMAEFSWTDGSRPTVVFVSAGQPVSAVVNMANMLKASFSVDYALSNAADGIEYQYVDRDKGFETQTLRVAAPGVTTALNPARIKGDGVTTEAHAAIMARYHLAQSLYQFKTINYAADIEHLDYRRLSVLSVSHDLTQWGYGGRVLAAERAGDDVRITLDEAVPPLETPHLGLRLPGDRDYRVWKVQALTEASDTLTLIGEWPEDLPLPGEGDNPMDTLWCYDFKATPGYRVRVTSLEPESDLKGAKVTCVPEGPEFWDYVLNGTYVPAPSQTVLPQHARASVKNLRVAEHVNVQGDTEWYELSALWDVEGDYDHAQVWAGVDGSELQLVDANAVGSRTRFRIDGPGQWLVEVRPFNAGGQVGQSAAVLYITTLVQRAPRNVDDFTVQELAGGLRRFAWQYTGDKPPALAGVQIRYVPGDVALSTAMWGDMTPLGQPDDVYKAQFETTRPEAGLWTFGIRAIDTAGQLSSGVVRFVADLGDSFEQVQQPDVTPPPVPTGLAATGAFATVQVSWDAPVYDQGHGHSRTEVWAGVTADIADAAKVAEAYAGPASFEWTLGSTAYVWARNVTQDGVAGDWAGPVAAQTAQDVAALGEVLKGKLTQSQLHADLSGRVDMIDVLDVGRPELGVATGLIQATAALAAADVQKRDEIDAAARQALEALLIADRALERITDAGVYVDPDTGTVKIAGLEATRDEVTQLEVLLDAVQGQLALKATTAYVDGKIAEAVLSPADLLLYEGLDARVTSVTQALNSVNGQLAQKASAAELTQALVRLTTAENNLDALSGQIALRVTRSEWESAQQGLENRISSAEVTLNALDVPSITQTVIASRRLDKSADKAAQALLRDILTGEKNREQAQEALAFARSELSAAITDGLQAEAQQLTQLAVQFGQSLAAVQQSLTTLSAADVAEAQARQALAAQVQQGLQALNAAMETEQRVRADADEAEAQQRLQLAAQVGDSVATLQQVASVQAGQLGHVAAQYTARMQLTADGRTVAGGWGITGTSSAESGPTLDFGVLANRFFVAAPEGSGIESDFQLTVQTTPTTANGVTIPAGLYVDSAFITNVSALWGRFGTLVADSIQATAISASQLTAGNGVIGGSLKSSNYVAGSSGWQLRPDGVAEFSGVIVRGTVYATSGQVGGWVVASDRIYSAGFSSANGLQLRSDGHIYARNAVTNVTFNTAATGAGEVLRIGTALVVNAQGDAIFGGTLSARVVDTGNIVGGAVLRTRFTSAANEITVGSPASTGSAELLSLSFSADAGRPMLMTATVCYQASNNWIAGEYGTQHTTMYYLAVARRTRYADGGVHTDTDIYSAWVGQATKLSTANYQYGLGVASASFQTTVPSVPEGGWVEYYIRMHSTGKGGFLVRNRSITAQEIRI